MPKTIRKMLAAFYTRPQAADLLARLTIKNSDDSVFDPACGSGTILVSAYKRKLDLFREEGGKRNPHKRFCEEEIFGSDIMPFAVHLTGANLASMDPGTTIDRTQIIQGDSLELSRGYPYKNGVQLVLFPKAKKGSKTSGEPYDVKLDKVDVILMNPPFTKVERGIRKFVDMERFANICGNEVGLWGHFVALANDFLKNNGIFGAVIPVNVLRGRESKKIREFIFRNWSPLYIIKSTVNYGFSEWSEYRDVLFIARKEKPLDDHKVKFILIKKDLKKLTNSDISHFANLIESLESLRSSEIDIESFPIKDLEERFNNLMWFCGANDFRNRDIIVNFYNKFKDRLDYPPKNYFREGYRPVPKGVSSFMFLTRNLEESRIEQAFLFFDEEDQKEIKASSTLGVNYTIEKDALLPSLRTGVGINTFYLKGKNDFIAFRPYKQLDRVIKASGFKKPAGFNWANYWEKVRQELSEVKTRLVTLRRIGPSSPSTYVISFFSDLEISPSNVLNVIRENDEETAKAVCVVLNSIIFLSQFILLKEESTARYVNLRFYDYDEMKIYPKDDYKKELVKIFDEFKGKKFVSLRDQLDNMFERRYEAFWKERRKGQKSLFSFEEPGIPDKDRLDFDLKVCKALGIDVDERELCKIYDTIVKEMIITRGLKRE
jgi:type I restriction-modification system DNA methylase subunit